MTESNHYGSSQKKKENPESDTGRHKGPELRKEVCAVNRRFSMQGQAKEIRCVPARTTGLLHCVHLSSKGWTIDLTIKTQSSLKTIFPKRTDCISKLRYFPPFLLLNIMENLKYTLLVSSFRKINAVLSWGRLWRKELGMWHHVTWVTCVLHWMCNQLNN